MADEMNGQYNKDLEYLRSLLDEDELKEVLDLEKNLKDGTKIMLQTMCEAFGSSNDK